MVSRKNPEPRICTRLHFLSLLTPVGRREDHIGERKSIASSGRRQIPVYQQTSQVTVRLLERTATCHSESDKVEAPQKENDEHTSIYTQLAKMVEPVNTAVAIVVLPSGA